MSPAMGNALQTSSLELEPWLSQVLQDTAFAVAHGADPVSALTMAGHPDPSLNAWKRIARHPFYLDAFAKEQANAKKALRCEKEDIALELEFTRGQAIRAGQFAAAVSASAHKAKVMGITDTHQQAPTNISITWGEPLAHGESGIQGLEQHAQREINVTTGAHCQSAEVIEHE